MYIIEIITQVKANVQNDLLLPLNIFRNIYTQFDHFFGMVSGNHS